MNLFITYAFKEPEFFFSWILFIIFSICIHEFVHSYVALKEGDATAANRGHLTLNPFKQMGVFSLIMLLIIGICWGNIPVQKSNFKHKYSNILVSLSGPFANLILAFVFAIILVIFSKFGIKNELAYMMFGNGAVMNMVLFFFNMLPIVGFDGFALVEYFFDIEKLKRSEIAKAVTLIVFIFAFQYIGKIYELSGFILNWFVSLF